MNILRTLAAKIGLTTAPATSRSPVIAPRHEPPNLSASAKASDVQNAIRAAEVGDSQNLFRLYRDALLSDDHIQTCINTRKLAVIGQPLSIMPKDRDNEDDALAAEACEQAVEDCENWSDGLSKLLESHCLWPVASVEKLFRPADVAVDDAPVLLYTLRRLEPVNPFLFCWKWAYQSGAQVELEKWEPHLKLWPIEADGRIGRDSTKATLLEPSRHIVHRGHLLTGIADNWGGPGRCILGWYLLRQLGRDWFGRFMERYAMPFPKGKTNSQDPQAVAFLQEAFAMATKVGGIVIDREDEVELVQAAMQGGAEGHKLWHDVCNNAISRAITGVEAGANPAGLNAGQSNKAENVREDVRMFDQTRLGETLVKQLFNPFLKLNGFTGRIKVSFGGLSDGDAKLFSETLDTLGRAGLEIDDSSLPMANERLGFTVRRKVVAAPPAFGFPGAPGSRPALPADKSKPAQIEDAQIEDVPLDVETYAVRDLHGKLRYFSAGGAGVSPAVKRSDPTDQIAADHAAAVGTAMRQSFAPVLKLIEDSANPQDAEAKLKAFFADWRPKEFVTALEKPLQLAAAQGAVQAKK
jgi:phage gp29-like protein